MPQLTVQQAFELAFQYHLAGRASEAEALYRQILAVQPDHAEAIHLLGVLAQQTGRYDLAVELLGRARNLFPNHPTTHSNLGEAYRAAGRFDDAVACFRQAIQLKPDNAQTHFNLGNTLQEANRLDEAVEAYRQAVTYRADFADALNNLGIAQAKLGHPEAATEAYRRALELAPAHDSAWNNLGITLAEQGRCAEAAEAYRHALALFPDQPEAHNNLGNALKALGQLEPAVAAYRRALELSPDYTEALANLASALTEQGQLDEAIATYRRALELQPDRAETHNGLGIALQEQGHLNEAIAAYRRALELKPDCADAQTNLGSTLRDQGKLNEAIAAYRTALQLDPDSADAQTNLGAALRDQGKLDEAITAYRQALERKPDFADTLNNLGNALKDQGDLDGAVAAYRHVLELNPKHSDARDNLIYTLLFHPAENERSIAEEQQQWNRQFSDPVKEFIRPHPNERDPARRLRVGYVSPDFRSHVIGRNLLPLFECHDPRDFEIIGYSAVPRPDGLTEEFRRRAQQWRNIRGLRDEVVAEMIREDGVDILVDLTQHLSGNRLGVFARQPAPVQVSFAGYPGSAGVDAIQHRISDRHLESGLASSLSGFPAEQVFLIDSFWCYAPCGSAIEVNESPALRQGAVTFGSLNNFCKINEPLLGLWARVLGAVPDSRLVLLSRRGSHRQRTLDCLQRAGVAPERVEFVEPCARQAYLELYHRLDIVLDTFPYNGHTTSLDALWMGVPVVSLCGTRTVSRAGLSQLSNLGLPELVASTEEQYIDLATRLAHDLPRLKELRMTLRPRMEKSILMDAPHFARQIESCYRAMWRQWCGTSRSFYSLNAKHPYNP